LRLTFACARSREPAPPFAVEGNAALRSTGLETPVLRALPAPACGRRRPHTSSLWMGTADTARNLLPRGGVAPEGVASGRSPTRRDGDGVAAAAGMGCEVAVTG